MTPRCWLGVVGVVGLMVLLAGCPKKYRDDDSTAPGQGGGGGGGNPIVPGGGPAVGGVRGAATKADARNQLHQIGIFYNQYAAENGKPAASVQDFMAYIKGSGNKEYLSLQEGYFTLVPSAPLQSMSVVSYETKADNNGMRFVLMGDGSVSLMNKQQLAGFRIQVN